MLSHFLALAVAGALCAGCSVPTPDTALSLDNPANPAAPSVPFVRPVNVLATGEMPATTSPSTTMRMSGRSMAGMDMPGTTMSGSMAGMNHGSMPTMKMAQAQPPSGSAATTGVVNAVDAAKRSVNVTHQPIKAFGWPSMTMDFPVAPSVDLNGLKAGDKIGFQLGRPDADGNRRIEWITAQPANSGQPGMTMQAQPQ